MKRQHRNVLVAIALAIATLSVCRIRAPDGVITLSIGAADRITYYPVSFNGPELAFWQPHVHPGSCRCAVYYSETTNCPVLMSVGRSGIRGSHRILDSVGMK